MAICVTYGCGPCAARSGIADGTPDREEYDRADGGGDQIAPEIGHHFEMQFFKQKPADDGADEPDGEVVKYSAGTAENDLGQPAGNQANDDPTENAHVLPPYAGLGGMRLPGVEFEIITSSSFMSAPMSPNNGVDR